MNDPEHMGHTIAKILSREETRENITERQLAQAVLHLYKKVEELQEELDQQRSNLEDLANR